jgi:hypothetical protein
METQMKMEQQDFVLLLEAKSPIIITVPHGGMPARYCGWMDLIFSRRIQPDNPDLRYIDGEKISVGGDNQIMFLVSDILKEYPANVIIGLLSRSLVDYNRFVPEVAYSDPDIAKYYQAYHQMIEREIWRARKNYGLSAVLLDIHGFGKQPYPELEFDIILGTAGKSSPNGTDIFLYRKLKEKYRVFCAGQDGLPEENTLYRGDTTNLIYHEKYGIDGVLIEVAPWFRKDAMLGRELAKDMALALKELEKKTKET